MRSPEPTSTASARGDEQQQEQQRIEAHRASLPRVLGTIDALCGRLTLFGGSVIVGSSREVGVRPARTRHGM